MGKEEIKRRKGDLTGEMDMICFPVVKHVFFLRSAVNCCVWIQPIILLHLQHWLTPVYNIFTLVWHRHLAIFYSSEC